MNSVSKYESFETVLISRKDIKNADYNPRKISDEARRKLKKKIKEIGLVGTLTWNKRTGNLVGGHQRISILDELEKNKNYSLTVAAIDVDEKTEKEMNVFLNNTSAMGEYDTLLLENLIKDLDFKIEGLGFDLPELHVLCDNIGNESIFSDKNEKAEPTIEQIKSVRESRKEAKQKLLEKDNCEFYCVAVFQTSAEVDKFLNHCGFSTSSRYIDGRKVAELVGAKL